MSTQQPSEKFIIINVKRERAIKSQVGDVVITMEGELSCG